MSMLRGKKVRILVNRRSGFLWSFEAIQKAFDHYWDTRENDLSYQFCRDHEDGRSKARRAAEQGIDILLVVGGDGTVNSAGSELIGSETALGVIPMGSGNGFARHFEIPLKAEVAAKTLASSEVRTIDVGTVNDRPFFVTCSMAWDAAIVRSFEKSPIRGVVPYVLAGVYEFLEYDPQPITISLDSGEILQVPDPLVFTVANLTQFGGGAVIAPDAKPDDGQLELIIARQKDAPVIFSNLAKLFGGTIDEVSALTCRRFRSLQVHRDRPAQIQIDGELVDAAADLKVAVIPQGLRVLVPPLP